MAVARYILTDSGVLVPDDNGDLCYYREHVDAFNGAMNSMIEIMTKRLIGDQLLLEDLERKNEAIEELKNALLELNALSDSNV